MTIKETLTELVRIDSVSSNSNAEIIDYLEQRCARIGFHLRRFPYLDDSGIEKINLIAISGTDFSNDTQVELALVGHTDTVPYDPNWEEATVLTEGTKNFTVAVLA